MDNFINVDISQSVTVCITMALFFLLIALIFAVKKENATGFVAGFNGLSKKERETYDRARISLDYRNLFLSWAGIFLVSAVLCFFILPQIVWAAYVIWIISLAQHTHIDPRKAFEKYKLDE